MFRGVVVAVILFAAVAHFAMANDEQPEKKSTFAEICENIVSNINKTSMEYANAAFDFQLQIYREYGNAMTNPLAFFGHERSKEIYNALSIKHNLSATPLTGPALDLIKKHFPAFGGDERLWAFEAPHTVTLFPQDKNMPESYKRGTIVVMSGSFPVKAFQIILAE